MVIKKKIGDDLSLLNEHFGIVERQMLCPSCLIVFMSVCLKPKDPCLLVIAPGNDNSMI